MSRLDYITIAIVILCVLAIGFLVYKMTDLFKGDATAAKTEIATDSVEVEDDGTYNYEIDPVDSTGAGAAAGNGQTAKPGASTSGNQPSAITSSPSTSTEKAQDASASAAEDDTEETSSTSTATSVSGGKYMVLGGTFSKRVGADQEVAKLKKLGYQNARVELFNRGKYAVVLIDRFESMAEAERLVKKLEAAKVKAIVKSKQGS